MKKFNNQYWCEFQPAIGDIFAAKQVNGIGVQGCEAANQEGWQCGAIVGEMKDLTCPNHAHTRTQTYTTSAF